MLLVCVEFKSFMKFHGFSNPCYSFSVNKLAFFTFEAVAFVISLFSNVSLFEGN